MKKFVVYDIEYDEGHEDLPKELIYTDNNNSSEEELEDLISDFISNETGFCHLGFNYRPV